MTGMNYIKLNQQIVAAWMKSDNGVHMGKLQQSDECEKLVFAMNKSSVLYLIPKSFCPFDYDQLSGVFKKCDPNPLIDRFVREEKETGTVTGIMAKQETRDLMQIKGDTVTVWVDKKLTELFDRKAEYRLGRGDKSPLTVYENGQLVGIVCPVKQLS